MKNTKKMKILMSTMVILGLIGFSSFASSSQAKLGYYAAKSVGHGGGGQAFYTGVVGAMGAYGGAKAGAAIGAIGGPAGAVIGAGLGAL